MIENNLKGQTEKMGVVYEYTNGKIESVHYNGKSVDYT